MEMTPLFDRTHYHFHIDQNRPPLTKAEVNNLSQTIGGIKRSKITITNAKAILSRYEDRADKPSDSGLFINAGLKSLKTAIYWIEQALDLLESARNYANGGK